MCILIPFDKLHSGKNDQMGILPVGRVMEALYHRLKINERNKGKMSTAISPGRTCFLVRRYLYHENGPPRVVLVWSLVNFNGKRYRLTNSLARRTTEQVRPSFYDCEK